MLASYCATAVIDSVRKHLTQMQRCWHVLCLPRVQPSTVPCTNGYPPCVTLLKPASSRQSTSLPTNVLHCFCHYSAPKRSNRMVLGCLPLRTPRRQRSGDAPTDAEDRAPASTTSSPSSSTASLAVEALALPLPGAKVAPVDSPMTTPAVPAAFMVPAVNSNAVHTVPYQQQRLLPVGLKYTQLKANGRGA